MDMGLVKMQVDITLAVTSCGRLDLLEKTLKSFFKFNTYPIKKTIIVDDSGRDFDEERIRSVVPGEIEFLINKVNIGQIKSIDRLYSSIDTPYIFHCEDDWEFYAPGFIEESLAILESNPNIFTVWIRAHNDTNGHPLTDLKALSPGVKNKFLVKDYRGVWGGFTFNPGLRRLSDYLKLAPYASRPIVFPLKNKTMISEVDLSIDYRALGYEAVISNKPDGYIRHIGFASHIPQEWEKGLFNLFLLKSKNLIKKIIALRSRF